MDTTDPRELEREFKDAMLQARVIGEKVKHTAPSREHSLALTNLEQAILWAREDQQKKSK
jgi:hypothetical protein